MTNYELLTVIQPTLEAEEIASKVQFVQELLTKNGAELKHTNEMGIKNLAYEINKHNRGYYVVVYFTAPGSSIKEIERVLGIDEQILRCLTLKYENKKQISFWDKLSTPKKEVIKGEDKTPQAPVVEAPVAEIKAEAKVEENV